ncbi:unnamed protein product [Dicrocoelium dendriticum]|nr:unnamed protein product [Dicrocoelium dendriticum]
MAVQECKSRELSVILSFDSCNANATRYKEKLVSNGTVTGDEYETKESRQSIDDVELYLPQETRSAFGSALGSAMSCLGSAVGTGNIWRFPRIVATQSYSKGSLTFYLVWIALLFLWSIPIVLVEYAVGRFTRNSPLPTYQKFLGKRFLWLGGWLIGTAFFISGYYPVITGWCLYYFYKSIALKELPGDEVTSAELFKSFAQDSYWPVLCQFLTVLITGVFLFGGIRLVEKANLVMVPLLLLILIFTFGWSMTRQYAEVGIAFLLTPSWDSLAQPNLWIAAAGQNAFDTGAGLSNLLCYATYMPRSAGIVRYSFIIPALNNLVSLYASFTIFSTVFSTLIQLDGTTTQAAILRIMKGSGPGSTGLTFTWIPVLFSKVGVLGRVLSVLFFLCLSFAGFSSLLANIQIYILVIKELGVSHRIAVGVCLLACFICGLPSSIWLHVLENQDNTWGYALIVSGFLLSLIVIVYGPLRFRRVIINEFGTDDWTAPILWVPVITVLVPLEAAFLIGWWIYGSVTTDAGWYLFYYTSVLTTLVEWLLLLIFLVALNMICVRIKGDLYVKTRELGADPYDPSTYEDLDENKMDGIWLSTDDAGTSKMVAFGR